jgi:hypothetical protein
MFSATDVANFLSCHHLLTLDRAEAAGEVRRPFFHDPGVDLLRDLGVRHENAYLRQLADVQGLDVAELPHCVVVLALFTRRHFSKGPGTDVPTSSFGFRSPAPSVCGCMRW